jgi:hypothetical protein
MYEFIGKSQENISEIHRACGKCGFSFPAPAALRAQISGCIGSQHRVSIKL